MSGHQIGFALGVALFILIWLITTWNNRYWEHRFDAGVYAYWENTKTGERRAIRRIISGYSAVDKTWLQGGRVCDY